MANNSRQQIRKLFLEEASELLQTMNAQLLAFEEQGEPEALADVLRDAHSIKGTAAASGIASVEALVHNLESCLQAVRSRETGVSAEVFSLLYNCVDWIEAATVCECLGVARVPEKALPTAQELQAVFGTGVNLLVVSLPSELAERERSPASVAPARHSQESGEVTSRGTAGTLRVDVEKVDRLMTCVEDLVQVKAGGDRRGRDLHRLETTIDSFGRGLERFQSLIREANGAGSQFLATIDELSRQHQEAALLVTELAQEIRHHTHVLDGLADRLQDDIRSVRMVPLDQVLGSMPRMVRDLSKRLGVPVRFEVTGGETEVDRDLVEVLKEPLVHLLRNALTHGRQTAEARVAAGKPAELSVRVEARSRAGGLDLSIIDDGCGIDVDAVRKKAVASGLISSGEAESMNSQELIQLVFVPGFSTAQRLDEFSGRGLGLDIVRDRVETSGGSVLLESSKGVGTRFLLRLPLNLASMRMLLLRSGGQTFAVPVAAVTRVLRVGADDLHQVDGGLACTVDEKPIPVDRLARVLGLRDAVEHLAQSPAVVLSSGPSQAVVLVDGIEGEQELIVKGLGDHLTRVPKISGATVLSTGQIVPLLNVPDLVRSLVVGRQGQELFARASAVQVTKYRILVVDDSITTRTLEKSILEAAGYSVEVATDGVDALEKLRGESFDLILSDFQMPRMDGLELVAKVKATESLRDIPVVLVSSLASDDDRKRGLRAGADAYLGKGEFSQEYLLQTLQRFL